MQAKLSPVFEAMKSKAVSGKKYTFAAANLYLRAPEALFAETKLCKCSSGIENVRPPMIARLL